MDYKECIKDVARCIPAVNWETKTSLDDNFIRFCQNAKNRAYSALPCLPSGKTNKRCAVCKKTKSLLEKNNNCFVKLSCDCEQASASQCLRCCITEYSYKMYNEADAPYDLNTEGHVVNMKKLPHKKNAKRNRPKCSRGWSIQDLVLVTNKRTRL